MSGSTGDVRTVPDLVPNATNYIYAQATENTRFNRDVRFFSDVVLFTGGQQILLATATTNDSGVIEIDGSVRNDISFIEIIKDLINKHRHRGGPDNPSKIDLSKEVMGQLPGFRVEGLDASAIKSGRLPVARLPLIEHGDLLHSGVLTHAQLDSFVRDLSNPNVRLLGELSATNLMQLYLAFKHTWNVVDAFATNLIVMIPGITPDSQSDLVATTAVFDRTNHLIQGVPSVSGELIAATFRTLLDFSSTRFKSGIQAGEDDDGAFFKLTKPVTELVVESFDNVFEDDAAIPGWTVETLATESTTTFRSDGAKKVDGAFSVKLNVDQDVRLQATKVFTEPNDWTGFNELEVSVQTLSASHGAIIFQILKEGPSGALEEADAFVLLQPNETTTGFRKVIRDITNVTRDKIKGIRVYTETGPLGWDLSPFVLNLDNIRLNNNLLFSQSGRIRFRLKTPQKSQWAAISWVGDTNGGSIQARARSAPSFETFDQSSSAPFSAFFAESGNEPGVSDNRAIEVEIALAASASKTASPLVRSVTVSYITASTASGLTIDSTDEFMRASRLENAAVEDPGSVLVAGRIDVGDVVYGQRRSIQQSSLAETSVATTYGTPVVGINGSALPLSPLQAADPNFGLRQSSLNGVASVERLQDRTYLAADALNDRIIVFDREGRVVSGVVTNNVRNQEDLFPLNAIYNPGVKTLFIAWSTNLSLASLDVSKITISGAGLSIRLSSSTDKVSRLVGPNSQDQASNVSPILLSGPHAAQIDSFLGDASQLDQRLFVNIEPDAAKEGIDEDNESFATLQGPRGMPVFVGDIKYVIGLFRPISITRTLAGNWLVCNAKPLLVTTEGTDLITGVGVTEITSVIEIVPSTGQIVFSDNSVDFSLLTLGGAVEINERYIAVAGIVEGTGAPQGAAQTTIQATVGGGVVQTTTTTPAAGAGAGAAAQATTETTTDLDVLDSRRGVVKIVEKKSGRVVFEQETSDGTFASDVQLDEDGNMVIIEKSFESGVSSGRVVKLDEDGNVFFQFGLAELAAPNDVRVLSTGNLVVST
jgi:hypothetical protein